MKWLKGMKEITVGLELTKLARHPMTATTLLLSFILLSLLFYRLCVDYLQLVHASLQDRQLSASVAMEIVKPFFSWSIIIFAIIIPLFTATAFSQEFRQRTFYLWATSPIGASNLVIGKFFSLLVIVCSILMLMLGLVLTLHWETKLDWGMISSACLCVLLICSCLISVGLFISSLNSHPIFAITLAFVINIFWMLFEWINPLMQIGGFVLKDFGLLSHAIHPMQGIIYSHDISYYLLFTCLWLMLTMRVIHYRMQSKLP